MLTVPDAALLSAALSGNQIDQDPEADERSKRDDEEDGGLPPRLEQHDHRTLSPMNRTGPHRHMSHGVKMTP